MSRTGSIKMMETVDLSVKDKLLINILTGEAKRQSALLFLSKAINEYQRS